MALTETLALVLETVWYSVPAGVMTFMIRGSVNREGTLSPKP